jgi:hypothetical protein
LWEVFRTATIASDSSLCFPGGAAVCQKTQELEGELPMDVSQGFEVFLYALVVVFAVGTILSGFSR